LKDQPRKGQRIAIYPKELTQLETVLNSGDPNVNVEEGHQIAYAMILQSIQTYEKQPLFLKEGHESITSDETKASLVPIWMNKTAKIATGNRRRVLKDGPDVMHSSDEDAIEDVKPDEENGMYTAGMDPKKGPVVLTQEQVAAQKAAAKVPPRSQTPVGSSDDDDPNGPDLIWSQSKGYWRNNKNRKAVTDTSKTSDSPPVDAPKPVPAVSTSVCVPIEVPVPSRHPTPVSSDTEDQEEMTEDQKRCARTGKKKAAASQKAPAAQKPVPEAKTSKPVKGQESPGTKVSKPMVDRQPMVTRRRAASRAGGLRPGAVQGKRIRVSQAATLPKPESQSFSSAEVFSPWQFSGVQWHSVTTVTSFGYLACTTRV
jgi:hypothetical protein